jgi:hypothetical protein
MIGDGSQGNFCAADFLGADFGKGGQIDVGRFRVTHCRFSGHHQGCQEVVPEGMVGRKIGIVSEL